MGFPSTGCGRTRCSASAAWWKSAEPMPVPIVSISAEPWCLRPAPNFISASPAASASLNSATRQPVARPNSLPPSCPPSCAPGCRPRQSGCLGRHSGRQTNGGQDMGFGVKMRTRAPGHRSEGRGVPHTYSAFRFQRSAPRPAPRRRCRRRCAAGPARCGPRP